MAVATEVAMPRPLHILMIAVVIEGLIVGVAHTSGLLPFAMTSKSLFVLIGIGAALVAGILEILGLAHKHSNGGLTAEEKNSLWVKMFAAIALLASVLASAEDLSGAND